MGTWTLGSLITAPVAGAALITLAASLRTRYRILGYCYTKGEAVLKRFELREGATIRVVVNTSINELRVIWVSPDQLFLGAENTAASLNVTQAGGAGIVYQGGIYWEAA